MNVCMSRRGHIAKPCKADVNVRCCWPRFLLFLSSLQIPYILYIRPYSKYTWWDLYPLFTQFESYDPFKQVKIFLWFHLFVFETLTHICTYVKLKDLPNHTVISKLRYICTSFKNIVAFRNSFVKQVSAMKK